MSDATLQSVDAVLAACKGGAEEAGEALTRALQGGLKMTPGQQSTLQSAATQLDLKGAGLIIALKTEQANVVLTLPAAKGLLPAWCAQPDPTGESKLATLAQELGINLLPEAWIATDSTARWVTSLADALGRGGVPNDATVVPLVITQDGRPVGSLGVVWPAANPDGLFVVPGNELIGQAKKNYDKPTLPLSSGDLPAYTRSLLRITVPVVVTLAEKRQKLSRIIELGPGSIIQFDKSCEEMLELEVGNQTVASGEAVKVGDKFGLRITAMVLPDERFTPVTAKAAK